MSIHRASEKAFPEEAPEFQVAPMIDILLVLMTFFMSITSTEVLKTKTRLGEILLPVAKESKPKESAQSEILLNVLWSDEKKQGFIEWEEKVINSPGEITPVILKRKGNQSFFRAVVRAGKNVPYSFVQQVLAACADAEVDNITFSVLSQDAPKKYAAAPP